MDKMKLGGGNGYGKTVGKIEKKSVKAKAQSFASKGRRRAMKDKPSSYA
jgi:hypothetical protein